MANIDVGMKAPDFKLLDTDLQTRSLSEFLNKGKPVILLFFPGAFTSVCTKELCTFRDRMAELEKANASVIAVSVDSPFSLKEFKTKYNLDFTLLSDFNKDVIKTYGVVLPDLLGLKELAKRAVFIMDSDGVVKYKWVSDDPKVEPNYDEVIEKANQLS
ncbi:MAG TPA: peroxiredoxin [Thermoprotei archaeon]|nr:peroxiredoxin [Thermoprotei archaeon]